MNHGLDPRSWRLPPSQSFHAGCDASSWLLAPRNGKVKTRWGQQKKLSQIKKVSGDGESLIAKFLELRRVTLEVEDCMSDPFCAINTPFMVVDNQICKIL
eukprot:s411_g19.t1